MRAKKTFICLLILLLEIPPYGISQDRDSLLTALRVAYLPSEKVAVLNMLAATFADEDPARAESYASEALSISETIEDLKGRTDANNILGKLAHIQRKSTEAMNYLLLAEKGYTILGDEHGLASTYQMLGEEYKNKHEYEKALNLLFQAAEIFAQEKNDKELAETYNIIGGTFFDQGIYNKSFDYFMNSLDLFDALDETNRMGSLYNNLGEIYRLNKDYPKALEYYRKALAISIQFNDRQRLAILYTNLGNTYLEKDILDSAEYYLTLGLELSNYTRDIIPISSTRISIGKLWRARGDTLQAFENLKAGYDLAVEASNHPNIMDASGILSDLYAEKNDFENAYRYYIQFRSSEDTLHKISHLEKITRMEMNLYFDLEKEGERIKEQQTNLRYLTVAFILISFILLVVLLYGRQRIRIMEAVTKAGNLRLEKKQLQEDIEHKDRELATNVMYLVKKNELINFISEKLLRAKKDFKPTLRVEVEKILLDLQSNIDENIWKAFEDRFREVHKDFYRNLMDRFPNLSENEKKLCAFIRLNMNTKEIAAITHQNPNSIEVARTRLRKKLNISNEEISLNHFLTTV